MRLTDNNELTLCRVVSVLALVVPRSLMQSTALACRVSLPTICVCQPKDTLPIFVRGDDMLVRDGQKVRQCPN
jgi:hypothetical protein